MRLLEAKCGLSTAITCVANRPPASKYSIPFASGPNGSTLRPSFSTYSMETSDHVPINRDRDACCDPASRPGNTSMRNASPPAIGARCNFIAQSREYYVSPQSSPTTAIMIIHCYPNTLFAGAEQCAAPILPKCLRLRQ